MEKLIAQIIFYQCKVLLEHFGPWHGILLKVATNHSFIITIAVHVNTRTIMLLHHKITPKMTEEDNKESKMLTQTLSRIWLFFGLNWSIKAPSCHWGLKSKSKPMSYNSEIQF